MEIFISYIKNIVVFLLFFNVSELIMPEKYKGYIKLILGFVLIMLVVGPIKNILFSSNLRLDEYISGIANDLEIHNMRQSIQSEEVNRDLILKTYKENLNQQATGIIEGTSNYELSDVSFVIDETDENLGQIKNISLVVYKVQEKNKNKGLIYIEPVEIKAAPAFGKPAPDDYSEDIIYLKNLLNDFYKIDNGNIYINVQERSE